MRWEEGSILEPDAVLYRDQLIDMSAEEMLAFFKPYMPKPAETAVISRPSKCEHIIHLFTSLHSQRPACGVRLPFEPDNSTFSRPHATCGHCLQVVSEEAA